MEELNLSGPGIISFMQTKMDEEGIEITTLIKNEEAFKEWQLKCCHEYIELYGKLDPY